MKSIKVIRSYRGVDDFIHFKAFDSVWDTLNERLSCMVFVRQISKRIKKIEPRSK